MSNESTGAGMPRDPNPMVELFPEGFRRYLPLINLRRYILTSIDVARPVWVAVAREDFLPEGWETQLPDNVTVRIDPWGKADTLTILREPELTDPMTTTWPPPPSPLNVILPASRPLDASQLAC